MADNSKIEWTDATWNPVRARLLTSTGLTKIGTHCEHVSEGCRFCYAGTFNRRGLPGAGTGLDYKPGHRDKLEHFLDEKMLLAPLRRKKPTRYFLSSLTDVFGAWVTAYMLDRLFAVMALCPQHVFQVLTKRPERAQEYLANPATPHRIARAVLDMAIADPALLRVKIWPVVSIGDIDEPSEVTITMPLPNVWLGTSVEDQAAADERIPHLLATPAAVRFLSCEPLLGPLALGNIDCHRRPDLPGFYWINVLTGENDDMCRPCAPVPRIDWVITGGESGPGARPMHPDWARGLRAQCAAAGVPFFFKQWGDWIASTDHPYPAKRLGEFRHVDRGAYRDAYTVGMNRVGKADAGRLLDGIEHNGMPA